MPYYIFENSSGHQKEIFFHMNDKKEYVDDAGQEWKRVFTACQAAIDTKINPMDSKDFVSKTSNKKGETLGNIWDRSRECSEKREKLCGRDEIAIKSKEQAKKRRKGRDMSQVNKNRDKTFVI